LVVKFDSLQQHVIHLVKVFFTLKSYGMKLNLEKCVFGVESRELLGFMLTNKVIEAKPDKSQAIINNVKAKKH